MVIGDIWNEPKRPLPPRVPLDWRRVGVNALALVPAVLVGAAFHAAWWSSERTPSGRYSLTICESGFVDALWMTGWATWLVLAVWSFIPRRFGGPHRALVLVVALPMAVVSFLGSWSRAWTHFTPTAIAPDGTRWRARWYWDGGMDLDRVVAVSAVRAVGEPVCTSGEDRATLLVLPEGAAAATEPWTSVRFGASGIVLVTAGARCRLAFDPAAPAPASAWRNDGVSPSIEPSPFALLGPADRGTEESVAAIEATIRAAPDGALPDFAIAPSERVLLDALGSANPWIVETARRFIRAGGPTLYPEATKRL